MSLIARIRWKRVLMAAAAAGGVWAVFFPDCDLTGSDEEASAVVEATDAGIEAKGLLINRPWLDHAPTSERDMVSHVLFFHKEGRRIGAVGRSSMWRQSVELFNWSPGKGQVSVHFPQTDKKGEVKVAVRKCKAEAPFDLCLTLGSGRSATTLYSSSDWTLSTPDASALSVVPIDPEAAGEDAVFDLAELLE